jgi:hypothetical protein
MALNFRHLPCSRQLFNMKINAHGTTMLPAVVYGSETCSVILEEEHRLNTIALWDIPPCSLVEVCRRFRGAYCLHHQSGILLRGYMAQYPRKLSPSPHFNPAGLNEIACYKFLTKLLFRS